ncbi:MAG: sulfurtransferase [Thermoanaerobaculia bacterium]
MSTKSLIRMTCVVMLAMLLLPSWSYAARQEMIVSTEWLSARLDGQVIIVDVAEKADYEKGHIPGARLLERRLLMVTTDGVPNEIPPIADFEALMTRLGIGDKTRVVFYARDPLLPTRAWFTFDYFGQGHRASVLNGGYARWVSEKRATTTDVPLFEPSAFSAMPNPAALTTLRVMKALVRSRASLGDSLAVIDARPETGYRGDLAGTGVNRPGHIPGAINVSWQKNLTGPEDGALFRSDEELQALYARLGVNRNTTVITYCRTGVEASMTYFVLRYLGFDPSLYDGSFVEWSGDPDTPVT